MRYGSPKTKWKFIMYHICHEYCIPLLFKKMLVPPHFIRAMALLIYKHTQGCYMRYFRHPAKGYARYGRYLVGDDLPGVYAARICFRSHPEIHVPGCDLCQVGGVAEEIPDIGQRRMNMLCAYQFVYCHKRYNTRQPIVLADIVKVGTSGTCSLFCNSMISKLTNRDK
jgi:hypothetical protein